MAPLFTNNGNGVLLDSFVDRRFGRHLDESCRSGQLPYRRPWVGIIHCPPSIPSWACYRYSPSYYMRLRTWQTGMPYCRGLITLSTRMMNWLRGRVDVPVVSVKHPMETPPVRFSFQRFLDNPKRRVIQVGWWLRRFSSIYRLPVRSIRKAMLLPFSDPETRNRILPIMERDVHLQGAPPLADWNVEIIDYQSPESYDRLLAENLVFLHLYETVANNAILECIVRNTPLLVNRLPDVVEYLGERYPLYFEDLEDAVRKAEDVALIREAHDYLRELSKDDLSATAFRSAIAQSELYRRL